MVIWKSIETRKRLGRFLADIRATGSLQKTYMILHSRALLSRPRSELLSVVSSPLIILERNMNSGEMSLPSEFRCAQRPGTDDPIRPISSTDDKTRRVFSSLCPVELFHASPVHSSGPADLESDTLPFVQSFSLLMTSTALILTHFDSGISFPSLLAPLALLSHPFFAAALPALPAATIDPQFGWRLPPPSTSFHPLIAASLEQTLFFLHG
ncbi:hypothetical protein BO82DRAFT_65687 [Aspergillus uvarum CBS 121591]|uniref:Uncharacterized protein n=1 Tax=Aspergillus uvarum CBS 121591 TaxID=1448315 RepID=A0A319CA34_9EURO|nr:hypothetical protein BO82DRAFT_65687 [Aspergillus uvarum CBS 121591]PYH82325.1 hypothetical protein BO82DRAFT_65687 [Aspergillus uvarum CBS 121591]